MTTTFPADRVGALLETLELMAAGQIEKRLPISKRKDELDAIAYGINVLVSELELNTASRIEAQNEFLGKVSHEIRTPIAAMLGFAELLAADELSRSDRVDLLDRLRANGQALLSLIGDLLEVTRLEADKVALMPEPVPVFELVQEVLASLEIESRKKALDVRFEMWGNALGTIVTDRHRLRQILVNVVANAVKFTEKGGITISLRLASTAEGEWSIDVTDTGIGIAPDRQASVFDPFEQADSSIARKYGGTGLGLALSRRLAERLGGSLTLVRSEPGEGSTFRLTLKSLPDAPPLAAESPSESRARPDGEIHGLRVLLAEDHQHMQVAMSRLLEQAGAHVEVAADGREAVARARAGTFDVVLMDLRMPHLDGLEATRQLRSEGYSAPIFAITADPAPIRRTGALEAGCDACLTKPFTMGDLVTSLQARAH